MLPPALQNANVEKAVKANKKRKTIDKENNISRTLKLTYLNLIEMEIRAEAMHYILITLLIYPSIPTLLIY